MARILVIDDQEHIRTLISKILSIDGHVVESAVNGKVGMKMIENNPYDIVITDIIMPDMDGLEVILELKKRSSPIPLIVTTGGAARLEIQELLTAAKHLGADRVIPKPLDFIKLKEAVNELLMITRL